MSQQQQTQVSPTDYEDMADKDAALAQAVHEAILATCARQVKGSDNGAAEQIAVLSATYLNLRQGRVFKQSRLALPK